MSESPRGHGIGLQMLASGSCGNSILVSSRNYHFLIDAGLSCRELLRRLAQAGLSPGDVSAVIITHEHQDHILGVGVLSRRHKIPVYMNAATLDAARSHVGEIPTARVFVTGDALIMGDLAVQTYPVPHDASEPIGLSIRNSESRIGIALDMGYPTKLVKHRLSESNALVLEFNHEPEMLRLCQRPWEIKQRILGKTGHMSNEAALELLCGLVHDQLRTVVLAHISREANSAQHALSMVKTRLESIGRADVGVFVGDQDTIGERIEV